MPSHDEVLDLVIHDAWDALPEEPREEFLTRRTAASAGWGGHGRQESGGMRWEPLRPVVIGERAYQGLGSVAARLLRLAVDACGRRASTLGELHRVLRFPHDLPLMDPDRPLVAAELTPYARPDLLIEQGRPRFLELNNSTRLGGVAVTPRLAQAYARLCPPLGLYPPPSSVTARAAALARMLGEIGHGNQARLLIPAYRAIDGSGTPRRHDTVPAPFLAELKRAGLDVVQADLADVRLAGDRLLAGDVPVDLVLIQWGHDRLVEDGGGLAALRAADRAGSVTLFPRTESALISSKAVLAWLHEDCAAGLLAPADQALVRAHVPWSACLGLDGDPAAQEDLLRTATDERDRLIAKPAVGKSGNDVYFGSQASEQDWRSALIRAAREAPLVLQRRVEPDRVTMPFLDRASARQVTAQVPLVLSPFIIDGAAASVAVRHMGPGVPAGDVVIGVGRGARQNTALLVAERSTAG